MKFLKLAILGLILAWAIDAARAQNQFTQVPPSLVRPVTANATVSNQFTSSAGTIFGFTDSGINNVSVVDPGFTTNHSSASISDTASSGLAIQLSASGTGTPQGVFSGANAHFTDIIAVNQVNNLGLFSSFNLTNYTVTWEALFNGSLPTPGAGTAGGPVGPENLQVQMGINGAFGTLSVNGSQDITSTGLTSPPNTNFTFSPALGGNFGGNNDVNLFAPVKVGNIVVIEEDINGIPQTTDALSISFTAGLNESAFEGQTSAVSFMDPWQFTVYDANGNIVPNLYFDSEYGVTYNVTDGAVSGLTTAVPEPSTLSLFGGLVFLLLRWMDKRRRSELPTS